MKDFTLCGHTVHINDDGFVSLTDMWQASGGKNQHRPNLFLRNDKVWIFPVTGKQSTKMCFDNSKGQKNSWHPGA